MKLMKLICTLILSVSVSSAQAGLIYDIDKSGSLLGVKNIEVNSNLYDVKFIDGTCVQLFNGCDESSDFIFKSATSALIAAQVLLDTVLIDTSLGAFDTNPSKLINGCSHNSVCFIYSPYEIGSSNILSTDTQNWNDESRDVVNLLPRFAEWDSKGSSARTYAVWSPATITGIPESGTFMLLCLGLIGFSLSRYKSVYT